MASNRCQCGIDEAGRGPVIGPMVMSIVCGDPLEFKALGARDSKQLSRSARDLLYEKIKKVASVVEVTVIDSTAINRDMRVKTLNEIEFDASVKLLKNANCPVYVDAFDVDERRLTRALQEHCAHPVKAEHRADATYPAVSAASIVSKSVRDSMIDSIAAKYGKIGSGYPADPVTISFLRKSIASKRDLSAIVRTEWETWKNLLSEDSQKKLY